MLYTVQSEKLTFLEAALETLLQVFCCLTVYMYVYKVITIYIHIYILYGTYIHMYEKILVHKYVDSTQIIRSEHSG